MRLSRKDLSNDQALFLRPNSRAKFAAPILRLNSQAKFAAPILRTHSRAKVATPNEPQSKVSILAHTFTG